MTTPPRIIIVATDLADALGAATAPIVWPGVAGGLVTAVAFAHELPAETAFDGVALLDWPPPGWLDALLPRLKPGAIVRMPEEPTDA